MGVSCRDFVPPEKACPDGLARSLFVGRCPTPCQGCVFEKGSPGCRAGSPAKSAKAGMTLGIHRSAPENQQFRHSGFLTLPLKVCCLFAKKFSDRPLFQKGSPGCRAGSPAKSGVQSGGLCKKHWAKGNQSNFSTAAIFAQRQRTSEAFSKSEMEGKEGAIRRF